jgi:aryl-alcohol dehydrogenase-like predicted oxidoreductase
MAPSQELIKKIALGTVQFGLDYGISNSQGRTPVSEVQTILSIAKDKGISVLDTAFSYGDSELVLGKCGIDQSFRIVSKFPTVKSGDSLKDYFNQTTSRLEVGSLYGYLAHDVRGLAENSSVWNELIGLRESGLVKKVGYSLYQPLQMAELLDSGKTPDIVQLPYSVFDRRFEPHFHTLKELGVEIHIRSAFLQGLLFVPAESLPTHFNAIRPGLRALQQRFANIGKLSAAALSFCLFNKQVDQVVVGVNNADQLSENINALQSFDLQGIDWSEFIVTEESILLPYLWPKK